MSGIIGNGWLNTNSLRNYPLSQSASCLSSDGSMLIPDDLFVDLKIAVPYIAGLSPARFYISSITVFPTGFVFEIGCVVAVSEFITATIPNAAVSTSVPFTTAPYSCISIKGTPSNYSSTSVDLSQIIGTVVIGNPESIKNKTGSNYFDSSGGCLESSTVSIGTKRLSGVKAVSSGSTTSLLTGQLILASGSNHTIKVQNNRVTFNAIDGGGLSSDCQCNDITLDSCIKTINGVGSDDIGNITISGGDCITVTNESGANGITLADSCAKPCCGCNELTVVATDVDSLISQLNTLATQIAILSGNVTALQNTCLASSVDPSSCAQDSN